MTTTKTKTPYGEDLVGKALGFVETAQQVALTAVQKSVETVRSAVPQSQDVIAKVDIVDAQHAVDSAFDAATRVLASQRTFVNEVLRSVLETPAAAPASKTAAA